MRSPWRPRNGFPRWALIPIGLGVAAFLAFVAIWQFLAPRERRVPVAYSDFVAEVHAGRVEEIKIHDRETLPQQRSYVTSRYTRWLMTQGTGGGGLADDDAIDAGDDDSF